MNSVRGVLGGAKRHLQGVDPNRFKTHFVKGYEEKDFSLATNIDEDSGDVPSINVDSDDHGVCVGEQS
jgi:hypothetical protein